MGYSSLWSLSLMWYNHHHLQLEYKHDSREKNWTLNYPQQHLSNRSWQFCLISEFRSIGQVFWLVSRRFDNIFIHCLSDSEQNKIWREAIQVLGILKQKLCLFRSTDCFYSKASGQGTTCSATHLCIRLHRSNTLHLRQKSCSVVIRYVQWLWCFDGEKLQLLQ